MAPGREMGLQVRFPRRPAPAFPGTVFPSLTLARVAGRGKDGEEGEGCRGRAWRSGGGGGRGGAEREGFLWASWLLACPPISHPLHGSSPHGPGIALPASQA